MNRFPVLRFLALALLPLCASTESALAQCTSFQSSLFGGDVTHVATVSANRVVISRGDRLELLNVATPSAPVVLSSTQFSDEITELKASGSFVYVLYTPGFNANNTRLDILDFTFSDVPLLASTISLPFVTDFDVSGSRLAVVKRDFTPATSLLSHYDVSNPSAPQFRSSFNFSGLDYFPKYVTITPTRTYVADDGVANNTTNEVHVSTFNSSNLAFTPELGTYTQASGHDVLDIASSGNYLYLARRTSLDTLNNIDPSLSFISNSIPSTPLRVVASGTSLFVAMNSGGVNAYSIATPSAPALQDSINTLGHVSDLSLGTTRIYGAGEDGGLQIIDRTTLTNLNLLGSYITPASTARMAVTSGTTTFIAEDFGLRAYNMTNPAAPVLLGSFPLNGENPCADRTLAVQGNFAYLGGCGGTLRIINIANPAAMFQVSLTTITNGIDYDIAFSGNFLYGCSVSTTGLNVVNISNPAAPTLAGSYSFAGPIASIEIVGTTLYAATRDNGLWILSIANPVAPQLIGFADFHPGAFGRHIAVSGTTVYFGRATGIEVVNCANPASPQLLTNISMNLSNRVGKGLSLMGSTLIANLASNNVQLFDVSNTSQPLPFALIPLPVYNRNDAHPSNQRLYADNGDSGLAVYTLQTQFAPIITTQPTSVNQQCRGSFMGFAVSARANPSSVTYQWKKNGVPLTNDLHTLGVDTNSILIFNVGSNDAGNYTCDVTNSCGTTTSQSATLTVSQCDCIDFNNDFSSFDPQDIDAFLSVYAEGPCIPSFNTCNDIDFNNDGSVFDPCDIDAFLTAFSEGGCTLCGA